LAKPASLEHELLQRLTRIADALERLAPQAAPAPDWAAADAFLWRADGVLQPVAHVAALPIGLLQGVETMATTLLENTQRFANGLPANNALLWGARGMGKSSLVKAVHQEINTGRAPNARLALVEIHREDIETLPNLLTLVRAASRPVLIFCDDLSFDAGDASYKSLKAVLEGGIEGRPANALFYATSNRRHLMPRDMMENERSTAINPYESVEEKVSLSDRFGLWLGFHACDQETYFAMIEAYVRHFRLGIGDDEWRPQAIEWAATRGGRSGRVAWQFVTDLAGRLGVRLSER
jgi:predicted AAA+ superfamily ATPase